MVVTRQKKHRRNRGERTYHGAHRNWRGGGNRGGRGQAGGHKHKWSYVVKYDKDRYGQHGFLKPSAEVNTISLSVLQEMLDYFVEKKFATKEGSVVKVDLAKAGYQKVLGNGKVKSAMEVQAAMFSKSAEKKITESGGKAVKI